MRTIKETRKKASKGEPPKAPPPEFLSRKERLVAGKALREKVPREQHGTWKPSAKRRDPIDVLEESNRDRMPELVPIRYGRMGWTRGRRGYDFFGRQLRGMKMSIPLEGVSALQLKRYAGTCGTVLARTHAKSGPGAAKISGYLGKSDVFDQAIGEFSLAYADQTIRDHAALMAAVKAGRIKALVEEDL